MLSMPPKRQVINMDKIVNLPLNANIEASLKKAGCTPYGLVSLVGAGPGDPELLTIKAMRAIEKADCLVFDRLVNKEILELSRPDCERIYVGKQKDNHSMPQDQIGDLLVSLSRTGKNVVRLKGGDCFVFGRGGEELDKLEAAHIPWQVVPGITAAVGCAASTGIPLTHRDHSHAITLITGHRKDGDLNINFELACQQDQTVVFYMGLSCLPEICSELIKRGKSPKTPFAVIANGTTDQEKIVVGDLTNIAALATQAEIQSPALLVMGDVVTSRKALAELKIGTSG